ncbi:MAG: DUF6644 family protein [Pseudomonadales bacterium]|nr:DUF6644 family protein [Pseudomonadales bacterium]
MFEALANSALSQWLSQTLWGFPMAEIFHLVMIGTFYGGIVMLDLRLLGINRFISSEILMRHVLRCIWVVFGGAVVSGSLLFVFMPQEYPNNPAFLIKMALVLVGGLNALWMHKVLIRDIETWDRDTMPPVGVRISALLSLCLWSGVLAGGRLIAYYYGF